MKRTLSVVVLVVGAVALLSAGSVEAQQALNVAPNPVAPGGTLTISGGCFSTASSFPASVTDPNNNTIASGNLPADGMGDFSGTLVIPASTPPGGGYIVGVQCTADTMLVTGLTVGPPAAGGTTTVTTAPASSTTSTSRPPTTTAARVTPTTATAARAVPSFTG